MGVLGDSFIILDSFRMPQWTLISTSSDSEAKPLLTLPVCAEAVMLWKGGAPFFLVTKRMFYSQLSWEDIFQSSCDWRETCSTHSLQRCLTAPEMFQAAWF